MKEKLLILTIILAISFHLIAVFCQDKYYIHSCLHLYVCQDQPEFDFELHYKWKARSVLLDQYIEKLVKEKKLKPKQGEYPGYWPDVSSRIF